MAVAAVAFDVGETLVDETGMWERAADAAGVPHFTLMGVIGGLAARRAHHHEAWELLGIERPEARWERAELYPDAVPTIAALRAAGLRVAAAGNMRARDEELLREHVDVVGSSERWGVEKPAAAFFGRILSELDLPPQRVAYVGDRVDNDVEPALAAGMVAVHVRRGPWGFLHDPPPQAIRIGSLTELPEALRA